MAPPSPRTNLWSQLKPKGHKVTGSAPPSLDNVSVSSIPAPSSASVSKMPLSFRDRGGRLQAFARRDSDGSVRAADIQNTNGIPSPNLAVSNGVNGTFAQQPLEKRSKESQLPAPPAPPVKQEMIDTSRYPLTKPGRYTHPPPTLRDGALPGQTIVPSPKLTPTSPPRTRARASSEDRHNGLFSGSQLGDSFMNSGMSTPQNELTDPLDLGPAQAARSPRQKLPSPHHSPGQRNQLAKPSRKSNGAAFVLRDDGFMTVVTGGPSRTNSTHMKDGFQDGPLNVQRKNKDYYEDDDLRPMSPSGRDTNLPLREVKIRSSYASRMEAYEAEEEPRSSSPTINASHWRTDRADRVKDARRTTVFHDLDDDLESLETEEGQMTPKPKKTSSSQNRGSLMESSMPVSNGTNGKSNDKKRRRPSPDYDDMALASMSFTELQRQPFDFDPSKANEQNGLGTASDSLESRLEQLRRLGESDQRRFFTSMSIDDWEAAGEWFVGQFAGFMQSLRQARQNKRRIIQEFEYEAATREEAVRQRSDAIDKKLSKMRQDGQRVVEDKDL